TGDQLVLGPRRVVGLGLERRPVRLDVVAETGRVRDGSSFVVDTGELFEPDPMDLLGVHLERRPAADRGAIDRVTVRSRPDARLLTAGVAVLAAKRLEEGRIGRVDDIAHDVADPLAIGVGRALDAARD